MLLYIYIYIYVFLIFLKVIVSRGWAHCFWESRFTVRFDCHTRKFVFKDYGGDIPTSRAAALEFYKLSKEILDNFDIRSGKDRAHSNCITTGLPGGK